MKNYPASTGKELDKTTTLICCVFGGVMVVAGVLRLSPYPIAIGVILMAAAILSKTIIAADEGIVTEYQFLLYRKRELWKWEDIVEIFCEYSDKQPGKVGIHFTKENLMARRLFFDRQYEEDVIRLAKSRNPKIRVEG